jgi:hypothetical protein
LTAETQLKVLDALEGALADLDAWLEGLGLSTAKVAPLWDQIIRENGLMAKVLGNVARGAIPLPKANAAPVQTFEEAVARLRSPEYAAWLLSLPEPPPEDLAQIVKACRSVLPNVRAHFAQAAKAGPPHKRGGRRKQLTDPAVRDKICEEIKSMRGPGVTLDKIFKRLGRRYEVSDTTIKRLWHEHCGQDPNKPGI